MAIPILYDYELSAECYAVRLLLSILGVPHRLVPVDVYPGREHEGPAFRAINPRGDVPTLIDGDRIIGGSQPILVHLATRAGIKPDWYPLHQPDSLEAIAAWFEKANDLAATAGLARRAVSMLVDADLPACRLGAHRVLRGLERHLWFAEQDGQAWLVPGPHPTLADMAVFPQVMLCEEGGVSRLDYPAVRRWTDRVKRITGFVRMSGVFSAGPT